MQEHLDGFAIGGIVLGSVFFLVLLISLIVVAVMIKRGGGDGADRDGGADRGDIHWRN